MVYEFNLWENRCYDSINKFWYFKEDVLKEFILDRIKDIDFELIETDEKVSDETKSVLKVLRFKLMHGVGEGILND